MRIWIYWLVFIIICIHLSLPFFYDLLHILVLSLDSCLAVWSTPRVWCYISFYLEMITSICHGIISMWVILPTSITTATVHIVIQYRNLYCSKGGCNLLIKSDGLLPLYLTFSALLSKYFLTVILVQYLVREFPDCVLFPSSCSDHLLVSFSYHSYHILWFWNVSDFLLHGLEHLIGVTYITRGTVEGLKEMKTLVIYISFQCTSLMLHLISRWLTKFWTLSSSLGYLIIRSIMRCSLVFILSMCWIWICVIRQ